MKGLIDIGDISQLSTTDEAQALSNFWDKLRFAVYGRGAVPLVTSVDVTRFDTDYENAKALTKRLYTGEEYDNFANAGNEYAKLLNLPKFVQPGIFAPIGISNLPVLATEIGILVAIVAAAVIIHDLTRK